MSRLAKNEKSEHILEITIVILMGLTALLTAWASWIGSLHGGNQATNYTLSNNLASEGNSEYNAGSQYLMQDMLLWSEIADMQFDLFYAYDRDLEDPDNAENLWLISEKLYFKLYENLSEDMATAIGWDYPEGEDYVDMLLVWMEQPEAINTPFSSEEFIATYYETANQLLGESYEVLEQGKADNSNGDSFGLVTVIYSISLFMLGIVGTIKEDLSRKMLIGIAVFCIVGSTFFMLRLPMPTGFSFASYF